MLSRALYILLLPLVLVPSGRAQNANEPQRIPVTNDTLIRGLQAGNILASLIHAGFANNLPIGIVIEGDSLCRSSLPESSGEVLISSLIDQVQRQDPDYTAEINKNTLYVHPRSMTASTLSALDLKIPQFTSEATSAQDNGINLWMYARAVLVPGQTSMFAGGLQNNAEKLPVFSLSNGSVREILDHLIALGRGGLWVMHEVPVGWQSNPVDKPFDLLSYGGDEGAARLIKCPERNKSTK